MAKLKWVIVCERAVIERDSNALSIISMIEEVKIQDDPQLAKGDKRIMIPHRFAVVTFWERSVDEKPEIVETRTRLLSPAGKPFAIAPQRLDLSTQTAMRFMTNSPGFPWLGEGVYGIEVQALSPKGRWKTVGREKFKVVVLSADKKRSAHPRGTQARAAS